MSLRARLLAAAVLLVSCLALSGYLIIRTVENSELRQLDNQLTASVPIAIGVTRDQPPPAAGPPRVPQPDRLSNSYLAVISNGQRTTIASPQAAKGQQPQIPAPWRLVPPQTDNRPLAQWLRTLESSPAAAP